MNASQGALQQGFAPFEDSAFRLAIGIANIEAHHESIQLIFGQHLTDRLATQHRLVSGQILLLASSRSVRIQIKRNFNYNRKEEEPPINAGFLLHARGMALTLPGDIEDSTFIAPLPKKFETALKILRKYDQ